MTFDKIVGFSLGSAMVVLLLFFLFLQKKAFVLVDIEFMAML